MNVLTIIVIIWVLFVSIKVIRKEKKRGAVVILFIITAALVAALGDKFDYNGNIAALIIAIFFTVGMLIYDQKMKNINKH